MQVNLRPLNVADAERVAGWLTEPDLAEGLGLTKEPSVDYTRDWINRASSDDSIVARAIEVDGQHVGNIVLDCIHPVLRTARLSLFIAPSMRGRGIGRRAVEKMLDIGFREKQLNKIWLTVHTRNVAALKTYLAVGFAVEGVHRAEHYARGKVVDCFYLGMLRDDWEKSQPRAE